MRTIFTLIIAFILFTPCKSQSTDLSLKLEKGKEYKHVTQSKVTLVQEMSGQKIDVVTTIGGTLTFFVKDVNENGYIMDATYETLGMSMKMPQGTMSFNSESKDPNDIFSTILGAMKSKPFEVIMSKTGKVKEVKDIENLWETAINQFEILTDAQKEQIKAQLTKSYGAYAQKGNIESVTAIYPDKPVRKGDKWTIQTRLESGILAQVSTDYEFVDLTPGYALIKGHSTIKTDDKDAHVELEGAPMKYDLTGTMESEIKVDTQSGWIIEAKINQKVKGETIIKATPEQPNGMVIPTSMITEAVITNE
ncbi:MAG: DUF6263 family protein [Fermentimonas sp.]